MVTGKNKCPECKKFYSPKKESIKKINNLPICLNCYYKMKWGKINNYQWQRKNDLIELIKNYDKEMKLKNYIVEINLFDNEFISKTFKTEKEALNYIEQYI